MQGARLADGGDGRDAEGGERGDDRAGQGRQRDGYGGREGRRGGGEGSRGRGGGGGRSGGGSDCVARDCAAASGFVGGVWGGRWGLGALNDGQAVLLVTAPSP